MLCLEDQRCGRANGRDNVQVMDRAAWGALLRERKVTGRDASLPAPLLTSPLEWSTVERLGRCPKPHQRRRLWTPQGAFLDYHIKCNTAPKKERHCVRFVLE